MTVYKIKYETTGKRDVDNVTITTCDRLNSGCRVSNIMDAIAAFEEIAAAWGSYENRNAIVNIAVENI